MLKRLISFDCQPLRVCARSMELIEVFWYFQLLFLSILGRE